MRLYSVWDMITSWDHRWRNYYVLKSDEWIQFRRIMADHHRCTDHLAEYVMKLQVVLLLLTTTTVYIVFELSKRAAGSVATGKTWKAESGVSIKLFDGGLAKSWGSTLNPRQFKHWHYNKNSSLFRQNITLNHIHMAYQDSASSRPIHEECRYCQYHATPYNGEITHQFRSDLVSYTVDFA